MRITVLTLFVVGVISDCFSETNPPPIIEATPQGQTVLATATQTTSIPAEQILAIIRVLKARVQARVSSITERKDVLTSKVHYFLHCKIYLKNLEAIDTAGCPQGFRLAWLDYVQAWERRLDGRMQLENTEEILGGAGELFASHGTYVGGLAHASADVGNRTAESDTNEAARKCQRVALQYGVDASKIIPP